MNWKGWLRRKRYYSGICLVGIRNKPRKVPTQPVYEPKFEARCSGPCSRQACHTIHLRNSASPNARPAPVNCPATNFMHRRPPCNAPFYVIRMFVDVFTTAGHLSPSKIRGKNSTLPHHVS